MKALNIVLLTMGLAGVGVFLICEAVSQVFSSAAPSDAMLLALPFALGLSLGARKVVEKIVGYTLYEALSGTKEKE